MVVSSASGTGSPGNDSLLQVAVCLDVKELLLFVYIWIVILPLDSALTARFCDARDVCSRLVESLQVEGVK